MDLHPRSMAPGATIADSLCGQRAVRISACSSPRSGQELIHRHVGDATGQERGLVFFTPTPAPARSSLGRLTRPVRVETIDTQGGSRGTVGDASGVRHEDLWENGDPWKDLDDHDHVPQWQALLEHSGTDMTGTDESMTSVGVR